MTDAIAGQDVYDSTTIKYRHKNISLSNPINLGALRVGIPKEYHCQNMSQEVTDIWKNTAKTLSEGGASIHEVWSCCIGILTLISFLTIKFEPLTTF